MSFLPIMVLKNPHKNLILSNNLADHAQKCDAMVRLINIITTDPYVLCPCVCYYMAIVRSITFISQKSVTTLAKFAMRD